MTLQYMNGQSSEAVLLSRTTTTMRLAIEGHDDIVVLTQLNDTWVSDECEPVHVDFSWATHSLKPEVAEEDCICSRELAAHLIHMLYTGDDELEAGVHPMPRADVIAALHHVV